MQLALRYIERSTLLLLAVLLAACSSRHEEENNLPTEDCFLDIYVYAPGRPMATRADVGDIESNSQDESTVHSLQLWVFKHSDASLVGYLDTIPNFLNEAAGQEKYTIKVDKTFADNPENVDVYVVANAESCGLGSLGKGTSRSNLDDTMISSSYFGVTSLTSTVPATGLPMSAILANQPVYGKFPTLRIGTEDEMATAQLIRAVSKLRFVLCRIQEESGSSKTLISIDKIKLNPNMIPEESYLMPPVDEPYSYTAYENTEISYLSAKLLKKDIPDVLDPMVYAYETQTAQEYEDLINNHLIDADKVDADGVDEKLIQLGLTYLRESDRQLTGTISYTIKDNGTEKSGEKATFSLSAPGDFLRNHSWTIYVYFMDTKIHILTVTNIGMQDWTSGGTSEHSVHNW